MSLIKDLFTISTSKKHLKESITPHKICVAIMIRQFCLIKESSKYIQYSKNNLPEKIRPEHRRDFNIMVLKLIQGPDLTLHELRRQLLSERFNILRRFITEFDKSLSNLYTVGVGYLLDLAEYISRLTIDLQFNGVWCQINKNSILGCYLRRLMVFFEKLTFSEVTAVYEAYKSYYTPCQTDINKRLNLYDPGTNSEELTNDTDLNHCVHLAAWDVDTYQWSRRQAELFIATQAALLSNNEESAQCPIELNQQIRSLLKSNPDLAEAHFLSYLNYLRVKEFCGAVDSLYHSFDRNIPVIDSKNNTFEEKSKGFRYAALNLAVLHVQFDHKKMALAALKEAIMLAQEANDNICLQHALTWMYKLTNTNKKLLIEHSVTKSTELNLSYITSLGIQSYTQYAGLSGGNPKQIFENIIKSDVLNCQMSYRDLMSNSYAQKSSLWLLYGKTEMSSLWSQLLLFLNTDDSTLNKPYNGEGICQAICNVANCFLMQGEYDNAQSVLKLARKKFPNEPISHNWMLCDYIFMFTKFLHNGDWSSAENAAMQLAAIDKWESCLRMGELHLAKDDFKAAQGCVDQIIVDNKPRESDPKLDVNVRIRAMILLAEIHCASVTLNNVPSSIITVLNSALTLANLYHHDLLSCIIHLHIANVQLLVGMPSQALKILDACLGQIMAHGGNFDRARATLLFVKCLVADAGFNPMVDRYKVILEATEMLKSVKDDFHKVEAYSRVKDVLYLQAQLYNELQYIEDRNTCALEYRQYQDNYPTKDSRTLFTSF